MTRDRKSTRLNSSHTVIYTLSLHDALPILSLIGTFAMMSAFGFSLNTLTLFGLVLAIGIVVDDARSEEHTSELQSHSDLHSFPTRRSSDLVAHRDFRDDERLRLLAQYADPVRPRAGDRHRGR